MKHSRPKSNSIPRLGSTRLWVVGILVVGLGLRIFGAWSYWNWFDQEHPETWRVSKLALSQDGSQYIQQADPKTWASEQHRGWSDRAHFRPPLPSYYFVGLSKVVGFNRIAISAVQSLLAMIAYWLVYLVAARRLGRRVAVISLAVLCLHPVLMFFDSSLEDSSLALLCSAIAVFLADRASAEPSAGKASGTSIRWLAVGVAAGLAVLARPQFVILAAGLAVLAWRGVVQGRAKAMLAFLLPIICLVTPVVLHNHRANGSWSLVSDTFGQNMYWGNGPHPEYRTSLLGFLDIWEVDNGSPSSLLAEGLKARTGKATADAAFLSETLRYMQDHPVSAMAEVGRKAWRHLSNYEIPRTCDFSSLRQHVPVWELPYVPYSLVLGLAMLGLAGMDRRTIYLLLLPVAAAMVTEVIFFNAGRYRALGLPFLVPLSVRGAIVLADKIRARSWRGLGTAAALLASLFLLGHFAVSDSERRRHLAVQHYLEAMLESYSDEDGAWLRFSEERFHQHLALARKLDPSNLDAFSVEQKMLIRSLRSDEALSNIRRRRTDCQPNEWLCQAVCDQLETLAKM
jgi:4-amino-4-deoxy-L-arabinose transferase-like glycosyltransferase